MSETEQRLVRSLLAFEQLTPSERYVMRSRFGLGLAVRRRSLTELAQSLHCEPSRVRDIEKTALRKMDAAFNT